ncbi:rubredoxin [candidate division WOR-3 bacterium]|nr:rubredoxin [candidate division WOR-3 bacterium]
MDLWQCTKCQYIYDPEIGDPENDIEEGTHFDDLPNTWVCPECGAKKSKFKPYEEEEETYDQDEER